MLNKLKKLEEIYELLLEISKQVGELLERKLYSELVTYLTRKDKLLKEASSLIETLKSISDIDTSKLKILAQSYTMQEKSNLQQMILVKDEIKKELAKANKDKKLLSAYNVYNEDSKGGILDFWE